MNTMTSEPDNRLTTKAAASAASVRLARLMLLEAAARMLGGQDRLATALGIQPRSLRAKLGADRGVSADDVELAAAALDRRAAEVAAHAAKLRATVAPQPQPSSAEIQASEMHKDRTAREEGELA